MRLSDALALHAGDRVAIVGGGGKTTLMFRLVAEAAAVGLTAVVGGTTRFTPPREGALPPVVLLDPTADPPATVRDALRLHGVVTCTTGRGDKGRWLPIDPAQACAIAALPELGLLVLEADGSRNRPFKAPGEGEPVIPACSTVVLAVVGLDAAGRSLDDGSVHRPERVAAIAGIPLGATLDAETIARVLLDPQGGRKGVPAGARWIVVLNKAEEERRAAGERIASLLLARGAERVVLACAAAADPVAAVVTRRDADPAAHGS